MGQLRDDIGTKEDLCKYRLETAETDLKSAKVLLTAEDYRGASVNSLIYETGRLFLSNRD